ncbi:hypothetical protein KSD_68920 [Ktedonobacter sp. SOSP1-85]|nr:hypothetical protein KSD_59620 [Ktedonobacter sp. SOSP1-85]GHO79121.1 hypothetical protein KSD_68920 [Ktedonobacter sp. SOSP1-85]
MGVGVGLKVYRREIKEDAMTKRSHKTAIVLEVQVMFEPNRLEHTVLHHAYRCLVPLVRRHLPAQRAITEQVFQSRRVSEKGSCHG